MTIKIIARHARNVGDILLFLLTAFKQFYKITN